MRTAWFKNWTIRGFLKLYRVDMSEAAESDPYRYGSFNEFFTRSLRAGARSIAGDVLAIACPVDGCVSEAGAIDRDLLDRVRNASITVAASPPPVADSGTATPVQD